MQILVTGSSGKFGLAAVAALRAAGHSVTGFDLKGSVEGNFVTIGGDCADFGQVFSATCGIDGVPKPEAVLHLAGIPRPSVAPDEVIFRTNTLGNHNVFTAAARAGIRRIVWASSETILGLPFEQPPAFVPLDESHPDRPEWSYSLTKKLGEVMADELVRWYPGLNVVSLRFSNICNAEDYRAREASVTDPSMRRANLWSYVDVRDGGEACRLAIEASLSGHERMIIAAADTIIDPPTTDLLKEYLVRGDVATYQSLESSTRAAELISYRPQHSWRDA